MSGRPARPRSPSFRNALEFVIERHGGRRGRVPRRRPTRSSSAAVGQVVDRASLPDAILTASLPPSYSRRSSGRSNPHASPVARRGGRTGSREVNRDGGRAQATRRPGLARLSCRGGRGNGGPAVHRDDGGARPGSRGTRSRQARRLAASEFRGSPLGGPAHGGPPDRSTPSLARCMSSPVPSRSWRRSTTTRSSNSCNAGPRSSISSRSSGYRSCRLTRRSRSRGPGLRRKGSTPVTSSSAKRSTSRSTTCPASWRRGMSSVF